MQIAAIICGLLAVICGIIAIIYCSKRTIKLNIQQQRYLQNLSEKIIDASHQVEQISKNMKKQRQKAEQEQQKIEKEIQFYKNSAEKEAKQLQELQDKKSIVITELGIGLKEKDKLNEDIKKLKNTLAAATENEVRERQKKEKINFYKLTISDEDLADVEMLEKLKASFHKPVVLSKLIWTQYFQKQMTDLCNRVLGKKIVCGIYKITNTITGEQYIGQSKNIDDRWKAHCKCGLGIDASATNALYNNMQKYKVWNFTFELLEECPSEQLNEKEAFWIQSYQSNIYGLNTQKGVTRK